MLRLMRQLVSFLQTPRPLASVKPLISEARAQLNAEIRGRVVREHLADANVFYEHDRRLVTGLAHDAAPVHVIHRGLGHTSCAKTVAAEQRGLHARALHSLLQNPAHGILVQSATRDLAVTVDRSKCGPSSDAGHLQPAAQCTNGTDVSCVSLASWHKGLRHFLL